MECGAWTDSIHSKAGLIPPTTNITPARTAAFRARAHASIMAYVTYASCSLTGGTGTLQTTAPNHTDLFKPALPFRYPVSYHVLCALHLEPFTLYLILYPVSCIWYHIFCILYPIPCILSLQHSSVHRWSRVMTQLSVVQDPGCLRRKVQGVFVTAPVRGSIITRGCAYIMLFLHYFFLLPKI